VQEVAERVAIIRQGVVVELADPAMLIHRALRRVRVSFTQPVDIGDCRVSRAFEYSDRNRRSFYSRSKARSTR